MKEINNALTNKKITENEFLQIYNVFINKFDQFSGVINKKALGTRGPNPKKLLNYENELKKLSKNLLIPQDQD